MNIVFWNCQGLRPKRKELQNYLLENQIDILALNETFLKPKSKCHLPGYNTYKNDRLVGRVEIILFIGMNIVFWNCQGLRPKRKELQNYLLENQIDILALNETFLKPKSKCHLPGYDTYKNDRLVGTKGGVAILVKKASL